MQEVRVEVRSVLAAPRAWSLACAESSQPQCAWEDPSTDDGNRPTSTGSNTFELVLKTKCHSRNGIATGRIGEPVAPANFMHAPIKANS
jgi:hypothetical protein